LRVNRAALSCGALLLLREKNTARPAQLQAPPGVIATVVHVLQFVTD
jgi:hypothetical protein